MNIVLPIHELTPRQTEIFDAAIDLDSDTDYIVVSTGRQVGKSTVGQFVSIALTLRESLYKVGFFEPTYKQCKEQFNRLRNLLKDVRDIRFNGSEFAIYMPNGSTIQFVTADNDNCRGMTFDYIIIDEACFVKGDIFNSAILPTVAISMGENRGKCLLLSTPKEKNWFYQYFNGGLEGVADTKSFKFTSYEGGLYSKDFLDNARKRVPEAIFKNEYLAEFMDGGSGIFKYNGCLSPKAVTAYSRSKQYYAAVDWGMENDYTVLTIMDSDKQLVVCKRWRQMDWYELIEKIVSILEAYGNPLCYAETNGIGNMPYKTLQKKYSKARPFNTTANNKVDIVMDLAEAMNTDTITIPEKGFDWLLKELDDYTFTFVNGKMKFNAKNGSHDDGVMSMAICNHHIKKKFFRVGTAHRR